MVEVMDEDIPLPEMASGMYARIEMRDTGAAISPHEAQHIFEPFYSATGVADSAGLGLSSAYGTTKQMGGEITVSGQSGQGNTFVIWLPTVTLPVAVSPERAPASQSGRTVLLVEGDPGVRGLVERIVEGLGHGLLVASNASVAARLCASHGQRVDVVIADVDLPDVTSEEMLDCLGSHCPDARIVLLSGYPAEIRALKARAGSRLSVISKPFTLQTVSDCLRDILRSPLVT